MEDNEKRIFLTPQQAFECLIIRNEQVHNYIPARFGLVGADWSIQEVKKCLDEADSIEIGGEQCRKMNHGIAVIRGKNVYFFEADNKKIDTYDNQENIEEIVKSKMQGIAKKVQAELPKDFGFVVLTFKFNEKGQLIYTSNANREDVVNAMKEFIEKTENNYGNDTGKY